MNYLLSEKLEWSSLVVETDHFVYTVVMLVRLFFILAIISAFDVSPAHAQTSSSNQAVELNFQTGPMLPDQMKGVTEIMPTWGFFYKIPMAGSGLEFGLLDSHANGVDFTSIPIRGRFDIAIDQGINAIVFAGPEINYYSEVNTSNRLTVVGFHFGGGVMYHILETLWFRADIKYSVNPGDSLYFGFGLTFRSSDGAGSN